MIRVISINKNIFKKPSYIYEGFFVAPRVGFEPTTLRLTAGCSTTELSRNI